MKAPIQPVSSPHLGLCFVPTWKDPFYSPPTQNFSFFKAQFNLACPTTSLQAQGSSFQGILWHSPLRLRWKGCEEPGPQLLPPSPGRRDTSPCEQGPRL